MSSEAQVYPGSQIDVLTGNPAAFGEQKLNVTNCAACDNRHDGIQVKEYARPSRPFTHWYQCPNTGDPVPLSLAMLKSGEAMELHGPICQALAKAQAVGRFLAAIFWHTEDAQLHMAFNEVRFPQGDYFETKEQKGVLGMLREHFERSVGTVAPHEMQIAQAPKALRDLLGNGQQIDRKEYKVPNDISIQMAQAINNQQPSQD